MHRILYLGSFVALQNHRLISQLPTAASADLLLLSSNSSQTNKSRGLYFTSFVPEIPPALQGVRKCVDEWVTVRTSKLHESLPRTHSASMTQYALISVSTGPSNTDPRCNPLHPG